MSKGLDHMPLTRQQRQVVNAVVAGNIAPTLSQNRKVLDVRTPQGRVSLEISGQGLTEAGREYFRRRGIRWRPRTVAGIDYERAVESTSRDGLSKFIVGPDRWQEEGHSVLRCPEPPDPYDQGGQAVLRAGDCPRTRHRAVKGAVEGDGPRVRDDHGLAAGD